MEVLLDTCTLIWLYQDSDRLPAQTKKFVDDSTNDMYVSLVSLWEIAIKHRKNPQRFGIDAKNLYEVLLKTKVRFLDITPEHIFTLGDIISKQDHNDPFDHILLATAKANKLTLLTHDENLKNYKDVDIMVY